MSTLPRVYVQSLALLAGFYLGDGGHGTAQSRTYIVQGHLEQGPFLALLCPIGPLRKAPVGYHLHAFGEACSDVVR